MPVRTLCLLLCLFPALALPAESGIRSLVVFGDSLCDAGNCAAWADQYESWINPVLVERPERIPTFPRPYVGHRASNGPTWIEQIGQTIGYEVVPSLKGGLDFAFAGAESGAGLSDQFTPNFHLQIRMYRQALRQRRIPPPAPRQLFVVWFGANDVQSALAGLRNPVDTDTFVDELTQRVIGNITQGILFLQEMKARTFLVPNLPPIQLTPYGASQPPEIRRLLALVTRRFNNSLEEALDRLEAAHPGLTILRLDVATEYTGMVALPARYGFSNVLEPAFFLDEKGFAWNWPPADIGNFDPDAFLSWDGYHPPTAAHGLLARKAMEVIPAGSWWLRPQRP